MCLNDRKSFISVMKNAYKVLLPRGYFVFDSCHHEQILNACAIRRDWAECGEGIYKLMERNYNLAKQLYTGSITIMAKNKFHQVNRKFICHSSDSILGMAKKVGFRIKGVYGSLTGQCFVKNKTLITVVLQK